MASHHSRAATVRHIGLASGRASAARAAAASHRSTYVAASERAKARHTHGRQQQAAHHHHVTDQSQLQSTLLMTVTVTIHSSLKNATPSPMSHRVTLNYATQTLSSAIPEPCKAPNIGVAGRSHTNDCYACYRGVCVWDANYKKTPWYAEFSWQVNRKV